jgi:hypothetical protein
VGFQVLHRRAAEAVVSEQSIAATEDECRLAAKVGECILIRVWYRRLPPSSGSV